MSKTLPTPHRQHFNAARLRSYTWNQLRLEVSALDEGKGTAGAADRLLKDLLTIEQYWAFPGLDRVKRLQHLLDKKEHHTLHQAVDHVVRNLVSGAFRVDPILKDDILGGPEDEHEDQDHGKQNYFEVLFVDEIDQEEEHALKQNLRKCRDRSDPYTYDVVVVRTVQDALIALHFNHNIQACVVRYGVPFHSGNAEGILKPFTRNFDRVDMSSQSKSDMGPLLGRIMHEFRPEVDRYYVTDTPVTGLLDDTLKSFRRIFYRTEDLQEMHLTVLRGIRERYETPFFTALKEYSKKPMGVFHAMPISRGNSVFKSRWIHDFGEFYGRNLFLAETSATTGGLDSLLQPTGPLKKAQQNAARAFGSQQTFFATNGTSSSNKIVVQALVEPGDVVLIDRDCHKSHHYGMLLSGAYPVYLHSYPLPKYSMYGAVPLEHIRSKLLTLKAGGRLGKVKMVLLTNSTFDGVVYNVERVMEQVLALKPDIVFLWDEAWFAFARFSSIMRQRTAMHVAAKLHKKYSTAAYRAEYEAHIAGLAKGEEPRLPDPDKVRIRVYATQSTHKTLSSLRQGSMIHIWDEDFVRKSEAAFHEAYMTHTSTSANYQILASMDVGRRQVEFEGNELVEKAIELGMMLRRTIREHDKLRKWFDIITIGELIPKEHRESGIEGYYSREKGWNDIEKAWEEDEFALDPTKINLFTGRTGIDGDTFKNDYLMDKYSIQVNKTSRNSVLFMTNIGTTRGSVAYLTKVLLEIADDLERRNASMDHAKKKMHLGRIRSLVEEVPPLPDFTSFHRSFLGQPGVPGGNLRAAYFLAYEHTNCEHLKLAECLKAMADGRELVSASFVIPYPPGFPVLVPGQLINHEIIDFLLAIDVKEIHGYREELGLVLFTEATLGRQRTGTAMGGMRLPAMPDTNGSGKANKKTKNT
ncbi:MAG: aminotransferase class I/II-fold pyridoxal phosphate-dependent enzyme [Flavobacteriales bacterium]|jgi:arginine decarboxylase|nr:aminotransferase class I/II-fold pyridoxal phosphate-dependent enzyme [Flavobacteriales bacterium]MBP9176193.1 aminotransferase class I/II-fold pyridoxal phosphate-dependent enzyme [Flavobacteriales bacterium]